MIFLMITQINSSKLHPPALMIIRGLSDLKKGFNSKVFSITSLRLLIDFFLYLLLSEHKSIKWSLEKSSGE